MTPPVPAPAPVRLDDLMHDAVDDVTPDLDVLTWQARRRGLAIRRRRQALAVTGAAAAVVLLTAGVTRLAGHDAAPPVATTPATPRTEQSASPAPTPSPTARVRVPLTGPATAAALRDAVAETTSGTADTFAGQSSPAPYAESFAELRWHPEDGSGFSVIGVNVQPRFGEREVYRCGDQQQGCRITHPRPGTTLMTYEELTPADGGIGVRAVADLLRADGVRVVASSTNGLDLPNNRWRITRARPVLSLDQLATVVSQEWWGARLDQRFATEGAALPSYDDLGGGLGGGPGPTSPTPTG